MSNINVGLSLSLIAAIILSVTLLLYFKNPLQQNKQSNNSFDSYMINVSYTEYNTLGQIHNHLFAPTMWHYPKKDSTFIEQPQFLLYTTQRIPWYMSANYGESINNNKLIHLWSHVKLHQPQMPNNPETTIKTQAMTFYSKTSLAKSKEPITIIRPGSIIHGKGVRADLNHGKYMLLSHTNGIYEPTKSTHHPKQRAVTQN